MTTTLQCFMTDTNTLEEQILKDHYDSNDVKASIEQEGSLDRWSKTDMVAFLVSGTFGG